MATRCRNVREQNAVEQHQAGDGASCFINSPDDCSFDNSLSVGELIIYKPRNERTLSVSGQQEEDPPQKILPDYCGSLAPATLRYVSLSIRSSSHRCKACATRESWT